MDTSVLFLIIIIKKSLIAQVTKGAAVDYGHTGSYYMKAWGTAMNIFIFQWKAQTRN